MDNLDPLLHQPLRTQIAAFLAGCDEASFSELKRSLEVSDGNLESHLKKLIAADYVSLQRSEGPGRAQTRYSMTPTGLAALQRYIQALQKLLPIGADGLAAPPGRLAGNTGA